MPQQNPRRNNKKRFAIAPGFIIFGLVIMVSFIISGVWHLSSKKSDMPFVVTLDPQLLNGPIIVATQGDEDIPVVPLAPISLPIPVHPTEDDPESGKVGDSYFDDAAFVGDSITTGIPIYNILPGVDVFAEVGLGIHNIMTRECIKVGESEVTVLEALAQAQPTKIYVMLGGNSLGGTVEDVLKSYTTFVDAIRAQHPGSIIYVQSVMPIHEEKFNLTYGKVLNNQKIDEFNVVLEAMCVENGYVYLDLASIFKDENGAMPAEYTPDGIHINKAQYLEWIDYLRHNTITE